MSKNTLIIKLAATGDVVRTTPLLHILSPEVYWVTKKENSAILPVNKEMLKQVVDIKAEREYLKDLEFDLVLCLEDDWEACRLASEIRKKTLIGSFVDTSGKLSYTDNTAEWFDMGLISKFGKEKADELKRNNIKTYQEIIFAMLGREFKGEEYILNFKSESREMNKNREKILIGIEARADKRWPTKEWNKYSELTDLLLRDGFEVKFFQQRDTIQQYISDINECDLVVSGDTLALHIALALKIKVVSIFTCTSPTEIYNYGRMIKIVSPLWKEAFYSREYISTAVEAVSLESVYKAVETLINIPQKVCP